jgi:hypothetical protein
MHDIVHLFKGRGTISYEIISMSTKLVRMVYK